MITPKAITQLTSRDFKPSFEHKSPTTMFRWVQRTEVLFNPGMMVSLSMMLSRLAYFRKQIHLMRSIEVWERDIYVLTLLSERGFISDKEWLYIVSYIASRADVLASLPTLVKSVEKPSEYLDWGDQFLMTRTDRMSRRASNAMDDMRARQPHESRSQIMKNKVRRTAAKQKLLARYFNS